MWPSFTPTYPSWLVLGRCGLVLPQITLPDWHLVDVPWLYPNLPFLAGTW